MATVCDAVTPQECAEKIIEIYAFHMDYNGCLVGDNEKMVLDKIVSEIRQAEFEAGEVAARICNMVAEKQIRQAKSEAYEDAARIIELALNSDKEKELVTRRLVETLIEAIRARKAEVCK